MCRARCITHQGRVISATGVHNHPPHIKSPATLSDDVNQISSQPIVIASSTVSTNTTVPAVSCNPINQSIRIVPSSQQQTPSFQHMPTIQTFSSQSTHLPVVQHIQSSQANNQHMHHIISGGAPQTITTQNILNSNNIMHPHHLATSIHGLPNIGPILNPLQQHPHHVLTNIHPPSSLQITPVINSSHLHSPNNHQSRNTILPPPPPPIHQTVVQQTHESPSPNNTNHLHHQTQTSTNMSTATPNNSVVVQTSSTSYTIHQTEDSNQHSVQNQEQNHQQQQHQGNIIQNVQNIETPPQMTGSQQNQNSQTFKIEHI